MVSIPKIKPIVLVLALTGATTGWASVDCELKKDIRNEQSRAGPCKFNAHKKSFDGTPAQQASCLTREVKRGGEIGDATITPFLENTVGQLAPDVKAVQALLDAQKIKVADVGGPVNQPVSANYFIIHDTSSPNCTKDWPSTACQTRGELPTDRDDASWIYNKSFGGHPKPYPDRIAHVVTNRVGASVTEVNLADQIATTKFETCIDANAKTKLFVGVENIQPRVGDPKIPKPGTKGNDVVAPTPGFTEKQYERLALLYVVASARRGHWLIPAYHAVIDQHYKGGHDDPQHFDMTAFSAAVQKYSEDIARLQ